MEAITFAGVLGAIMGSFLNVVTYRLPRHESLVTPASHCPRCATPVKPYDNIPILSWLLLRGHCRSCAAPISPRYPPIEPLLRVFIASGVQELLSREPSLEELFLAQYGASGEPEDTSANAS